MEQQINPGSLFLVFGLFIMGVCGIVNRILKRPVVNGGMISFVLTSIPAAALFVVVLTRLPDLPPEGQGYAIGKVFGTFLIPWLVFGYSWQSFNKKKSEQK
jgi:hypothetical protein